MLPRKNAFGLRSDHGGPPCAPPQHSSGQILRDFWQPLQLVVSKSVRQSQGSSLLAWRTRSGTQRRGEENCCETQEVAITQELAASLQWHEAMLS